MIDTQCVLSEKTIFMKRQKGTAWKTTHNLLSQNFINLFWGRNTAAPNLFISMPFISAKTRMTCESRPSGSHIHFHLFFWITHQRLYCQICINWTNKKASTLLCFGKDWLNRCDCSHEGGIKNTQLKVVYIHLFHAITTFRYRIKRSRVFFICSVHFPCAAKDLRA